MAKKDGRLAARIASIVLIGFFVPGRALAAEDEIVLSLEPGYGLLFGTSADHGAGGHASAWFGISEILWLEASGGGYAFFAKNDRSTAYEASGGIVAALDVLRTIPFLEAAIGVVGAHGVLVPTFRIGAGADYLVSSRASIGGIVRFRPVAELPNDGWLTVELRLGLRFEL